MVSYIKKNRFEDYILQCWEPVLSEKSSPPGKSGNAISLVYGELKTVAIKPG